MAEKLIGNRGKGGRKEKGVLIHFPLYQENIYLITVSLPSISVKHSFPSASSWRGSPWAQGHRGQRVILLTQETTCFPATTPHLGGFQWRTIRTRFGRSGVWAGGVVLGDDQPGSDPHLPGTPGLKTGRSLKRAAFSHLADKPG